MVVVTKQNFENWNNEKIISKLFKAKLESFVNLK